MAASETSVRFEKASDQTLLVSFGERITREAHEAVARFLRELEQEPVEGVRNVHPAYCSVLVKFDGVRRTHEDIERVLRQRVERAQSLALPEPRLVEIPVCYGGEFGPDLEDVARAKGMQPEEVIALHTAATYTVFFLGFVPGFAYLGELPQELATPRLPSPRKSVPAGSVGIAARQTGVYPFTTPGGWRLLGRTPLKMFEAGNSLLRLGDQVKFAPISRERFAEF